MFNDTISFIALSALNSGWPKIPAQDFIPLVIIILFITLSALEITSVRSKQLKSIIFQSYRTNLFIFIFNEMLFSVLSVSTLLLLAERFNHFGLLTGCDLPLQAIISFILFDLTLYLWHRASHNFDCLWIFHKVHHSDKSMNVSTAFRIHFAELFLNMLVKAAFIIAMGVEATIVVLCEAVSTLFIIFHHANLSFNNEKLLQWLIIVPSLHRTHHSSLRKEHDSNYGAVLSIWDRCFGSLAHYRPEEIGLKNINAQNFIELLRFGIISAPATPTQTQPHANAFNIDVMIAEAAYYKAEKRGFAPGCDLLDWLNAEQEIKNCRPL